MPAGIYSDSINYRGWAAWPKKEANSPGCSYNYPHVTAAHWVMYRLARHHVGLVTETPWRTSLKRAYHTAMARSEEHTSELQSLMRISYAVFCLKKKKNNNTAHKITYNINIHTTIPT